MYYKYREIFYFVHQLLHRIWDKLLINSHELEILYTQSVHRQIALNVTFLKSFTCIEIYRKNSKTDTCKKNVNFLPYWDLNSGSTTWAITPALFNVGWVFFEIGSHELLVLGWHHAMILLISATWVARITHVSHRCLAWRV
jgi:hypothetical protein